MKLLNCKKSDVSLLVDDDDFAALQGRRIGWNGRRGAYFMVDRKKVYVHRWIYSRMLLDVEQGLLAERNVGFKDGDVTNCRRDNLFTWPNDRVTKQDRAAAKRQALLEARALDEQRWLMQRERLQEGKSDNFVRRPDKFRHCG